MQKRRIKRLHGSPYVISLEPTDLLGQGSFGRVVRAFNLEDSSEDLVAKIMEITNSSSLRTLKQEFNILEAFQSNHHNLVQYKRLKLYSQKAYYIIMEHCNSGTLEQKIDSTKFIPEIEVINFLDQFASGYRELYNQKIIHRDLKPANILIHQNRIYKIADFGLAKIVDTLQDKFAISMKGTPLYMAPEIINEAEAADSKIDVWSLGIILYRMLFGGAYPFIKPNKKYTREVAFNDIIKNELKFPGVPKRSSELLILIQRMLKKTPAERISWEQIFSHPLVQISGSQQVAVSKKMINSSMFIKQMIIQRVSVIKMVPFKQKNDQFQLAGLLKGINKVVTEQDVMEENKFEEEKNKIIIEDILANLNKNQQMQRSINRTEDILLFLREQVFFIDKTALRVSTLSRVLTKYEPELPGLLVQLTIWLLEKALLINNNLKLLTAIPQITEEAKKIFRKSENWPIMGELLDNDEQGLQQFLDDFKDQKAVVNPKDLASKAFKMVLQLLNDHPEKVKAIYITFIYLFNVLMLEEKIEAFDFNLDEFMRFQEETENISDEEVQSYGIPNLLQKIHKCPF